MRKVAIVALSFAPWAFALIGGEGPVPNLPKEPYNYANPALPPHFSNQDYHAAKRMDNTPYDNPVTDAGATLGRVLFYDKRLSKNDTVSCGSCHVQKYAFTDPERFSTGFEGKKTTRTSMPLVNVRYHEPRAMFWDERAPSLERQVLMPIEDPIEMGISLEELVPKLQKTSFYPPLFEKAFGSPNVDTDRISRALAQFVRSIISHRSKFDRALTDGLENVLTEQERLGHSLFFGQTTPRDPQGFLRTGRLGTATCANCHRGNVQASDGARNNGLDADRTLDPGKGGRFKSPSLRNAGARAHFMHDGRFKTLREVVEHYNSGIVANPVLDPLLRSRGGAARLGMTEEEKAALVAFLEALTDHELLSDPRFSDPFAK